MPRKKHVPVLIPIAPSTQDEKDLVLGQNIRRAIAGHSAKTLANARDKNHKGVIAQVMTAVVAALHEEEEAERKPGDQWRGDNALRSVL